MGFSPEQIEAEFGTAEEGVATLHVLPSNADILHVYMACQWRYLPITHPQGGTELIQQGIDASEINAVMDALTVPQTERAHTFAGVREMASEAIAVHNEQRATSKEKRDLSHE